MKLTDQIQQRISQIVLRHYGEPPDALKIGYPPNPSMGDMAVECFPMARQFRKAPAEIAGEIAEWIEPDDLIDRAAATGPYVNITLRSEGYFGYACRRMFESPPFAFQPAGPEGHRVMVEYLSPNTNKPLHLGHVRNGALGMAVANLQVAAGHQVVRANLINDRGVHICKSMLAWQKWGEGTTPKTKGGRFCG